MTTENAEFEPDCQPTIDEVYLRVGRNLLLYQGIEHLQKYLVSNARLEGTSTTLRTNRQRRSESVGKLTMGQLVGKFSEDVLTDAAPIPEPAQVDEAFFMSRFTIVPADDDVRERHDAEMRDVLQARNELVHHFLQRHDQLSEDGIRTALAWLDAQHRRAFPVWERLHSMGRSMDDHRKQFAHFLASPEYDEWFELEWLRGSRLVALLRDCAVRAARKDGWTILDTAGNHIRHTDPEELENLTERYGHRTLKKLLLATGLFDVADEPMPKGGTRTIYRVRHEAAPCGDGVLLELITDGQCGQEGVPTPPGSDGEASIR